MQVFFFFLFLQLLACSNSCVVWLLMWEYCMLPLEISCCFLFVVVDYSIAKKLIYSLKSIF
ncbi:hypothetical protein RchiOBHm_Chr4g0400831 [Rosa chinensis]|uniref:Uncharacterized protein n=1 Tax=Rosa chinensis TaxID=74649 RepID=A0A2P6QSX8_ROSCH|nr:hypothetical protein RchiOBHm_Chr4g0400831 [Rosa chinensis]